MNTMEVLGRLFKTLEQDNKDIEARIKVEGVIAELETSLFRATALEVSTELEKVLQGNPDA